MPGGRIEYGETPEETGVEIEKIQLYKVITNYVVWEINEDLQHIAIIYKVELNQEDFSKIKVEADGHDSLGAAWYKIDCLKSEELFPLANVIK